MALVPPATRTKLGISHRTLCGLIAWISVQILLVHGLGNAKRDSPPVDQSVSYDIEEGQRAGTKVGVIPIRPGLRYRFSESPTEFNLDPDTGTIITTMVLDRERLSDDVFNLFVQSTPSAKHIVEVKITVLDINDNSPTFRQPVIQISFSETAKPGTQVILDTATDKDSGVNGITTKYRLVSGNDLGRFRLAEDQDVSVPFLYLENTKELDREEMEFYQLRMSVQDGGTPPRYGHLTINITVQDYNDNPPLFDQSDYSSSVNETAPGGTSIIQVHATDEDIGANADITYSVINDDYNQFTVAPKTGIVSSLKKLYCYRPCDGSVASCTANSCMVTLEARDNGGPTPLTGRAYLTVNLIDENDHSPVITFQYFPSGSIYANVDEGARKFTVVAKVNVADLDTGLNGRTTLRIVKGNERKHFSLDNYSNYCIVSVVGGLDRERISRYNLTFEAKDSGVPSRSSKAYLIIVVNDINDHSPIFQHKSYAAQLSELIPVGSFVAAITATDSDTGNNAQITYTISSGNRHGYFEINSETGLVTTAKSLDQETESHIVMTILAKDGAARPQHVYTNLTVDIWDENDEIPSFDKSTFSVSVIEGDAERIDIATVTAVDNDEGRNGTVRYTFDSEVERKYPNVFQLNAVSGKISTLQRLDREEHAFFVLKLWAHDQGIAPLSSYIMIFVTVLDVNDNGPVVYPVEYYATVMENESSGTSVIQVMANDPDAGKNGTVQYTIADTEDGQKQKFSIDGSTGWIMTNGRLKEASYTLTVNVQDLGVPARQSAHSAAVHIRISKTMTTVHFSQSHGYSFSIVEDGQGVSKVGENVGQVQTAGTTGAVSYSIIGGDRKGAFEINPQTGVIRRVTLIDREDTPLYQLIIVAQNNGLFGSTVVNITIDDVNDNTPTFVNTKVEVYAVENWPVGHDVYLARAEDKDIGSNAKVVYTVTNGLLPIFDIHQETGMLYLAETLTVVTNTTFTGHVIAKDSGTPSRSSEIRVTVKVQPSNVHTPMFEYANYLVSVSESRPINDDIYHVVASDVDKGMNGHVTYSLLSGNDNDQFGIFPNGVLYIANALDREIRDWYVLKVKAKDNGIPSRTSIVDITILVTDANDNSPMFVNHTYVMHLEEGNAAKTYIGMLAASDGDIGQNAEILYSFEGTDDRFAINSKTGAIISERSFDREELIGLTNQDYVTLVVIARDCGDPPKEDKASVDIHITDVNDNAPMFTRHIYEASVSESARIDTEVLVVLANDKDSGLNSKVSYFLQGGNNDGSFAVNSDTGKVTVIRRLDRETTPVYTLVVEAIDGGVMPRNSTAHMKITVLDDNDNAPQFVQSQHAYDISEDEHMESLVVQLTANDADVGSNATVVYSVVNGNVGPVFRIDSNSGKLFLTGHLDYEERRQYKLNITATDLGTPPRSNSIMITINVIDVNDNAPRFSTMPVLRRVAEGVDIGTEVVTINATDLDSGLNGRISYSIVKQEPAGHTFSIDHESGKISTTGELDRETVDNYRLVVMATDKAQPVTAQKSVQKMVTIIVTDVNDNTPEFVSMNSVTVPSNAPVDYLVTTVKAIDLDIGENGEIEYGIIDGDTDTFNMDPSSGSIYLRSMLTSNILSYDLTVRAQDKGQKTSLFPLTVFVKSTDDSGPRFVESHYSEDIYENEHADTSIVTVRAHAQTSGASVTYRITGITSSGDAQRRYFQVDSTSGVISTTKMLDRENGYEVFKLEVLAVELGSNTPHTRATLVSTCFVAI